MDSRPIGVFDSGYGGLTVLREIRKRLPGERFIYVGDTARIPYGPKSPEVIRRFALEIGIYLEQSGVKAIVVACNTASSFGLAELSRRLAPPVVGVVNPGARVAVRCSKRKRIGVIGTRGTISSSAYQNAILAVDPAAKVAAVSTPLLVPLVEEGFTSGKILECVLDLSLPRLIEEEIDVLVLGCTHYPLLRESIAEYLAAKGRPDIVIVDSAEAAAEELARIVKDRGGSERAEEGLREREEVGEERRGEEGRGNGIFYATDDPARFALLGEKFLGERIPAVQHLPLEILAEGAARRFL
ncbi:MAG: glutamate racemase [Candidatus Hydrogenedentota bacterium]|nr:MAG: glutamate racemase [Candidatus Hydrogenedentota bacterium]